MELTVNHDPLNIWVLTVPDILEYDVGTYLLSLALTLCCLKEAAFSCVAGLE